MISFFLAHAIGPIRLVPSFILCGGRFGRDKGQGGWRRTRARRGRAILYPRIDSSGLERSVAFKKMTSDIPLGRDRFDTLYAVQFVCICCLQFFQVQPAPLVPESSRDRSQGPPIFREVPIACASSGPASCVSVKRRTRSTMVASWVGMACSRPSTKNYTQWVPDASRGCPNAASLMRLMGSSMTGSHLSQQGRASRRPQHQRPVFFV